MPHRNPRSPRRLSPRPVAVALGLLALAGCDLPQQTPKAPASAMGAITVTYACTDGGTVTVRYRGDEADLHLADGIVTLPRTVSASGARYSDEKTTAWSKGDDLMLDRPGQPRGNCRKQ